MKVLLIVLLTLALLVSCNDGEPMKQVTGGNIGNNIYRYVDNEAGVVCWIWNGYEKGGIHCLPISETKLGY